MLNSFQSSATFHIKTSHLICSSHQETDFCMNCNTKLKYIKAITLTFLTVLKTYFLFFFSN